MSLRPSAILVLTCGLLLTSGCYIGPDWQTRQAQWRTMQIYRQNQILAGQMGQMASDRAALEQQLNIANQRLDNLNAERAALHDRYKHLLTSSQNPLPGPATARFKDLAERYPEFEFDPETGVSKFNTDLLFPLGSDEIRAESQQLLQEFASIMDSEDARQFNILVVGHTDDLPIKRSSTAQQHPTNWELSVHRGTAVVHALSKYGLAENRMGVSGYSMYQPVAPNSSDGNRQKNRRVEIYVLAPDARVATGG